MKNNKEYDKWIRETPAEKVAEISELNSKIADLYGQIASAKNTTAKVEEDRDHMRIELGCQQYKLQEKTVEIEKFKSENEKQRKTINELKEINEKLIRDNEKMAKVVQISNL